LCFILVMSTIAFTLLTFSKISRNERKTQEERANGLVNEADNPVYRSTASDKAALDQDVNRAEELPSKAVQVTLLVVTFWVSFIAYGLLPAIQSYSTLPYGNSTFHLSINIGNVRFYSSLSPANHQQVLSQGYIMLPIVIMLSIWSYRVSCTRILVEFTVAFLLSLYIIGISAMSPCPPLQESLLGPILMVSAWVLTTVLYMVRTVTVHK
jgi:hypothetical protein